MKLVELDPQFVAMEDVNDPTRWQLVQFITVADGIEFLCPICFKNNNGRRGTHMILCWRPKVPQTFSPNPGRWEFEGNNYGDLTLIAGSSSILLEGGCNAHFFVKNGEIIEA